MVAKPLLTSISLKGLLKSPTLFLKLLKREQSSKKPKSTPLPSVFGRRLFLNRNPMSISCTGQLGLADTNEGLGIQRLRNLRAKKLSCMRLKGTLDSGLWTLCHLLCFPRDEHVGTLHLQSIPWFMKASLRNLVWQTDLLSACYCRLPSSGHSCSASSNTLPTWFSVVSIFTNFTLFCRMFSSRQSYQPNGSNENGAAALPRVNVVQVSQK